VRVTRVIEGSPAHKAGLKGEATLTWKQAMAGVLTMTPIAPLVLPFVSSSDHGGPGDLILAVDGKRVHNREELEQAMSRFRPGDTIYFSVLREQSGLRQIPVQLVEYPDTSLDAATVMAK
jgi:S1-C subfamily serine protease